MTFFHRLAEHPEWLAQLVTGPPAEQQLTFAAIYVEYD